MKTEETTSLTILRPSGLVSPELFKAVDTVVQKFNLTVYLSTTQNLRLLEVKDSDRETIMAELGLAGARFKGTINFPFPKVCVSTPHCRLGKADTFELSEKIISRFGDRTDIKPKIKIAISGCPIACAGSLTTDIGVVATRAGFVVYVGGKLGAVPKVGRRIIRRVNEEKMMAVIEILFDYHYEHTNTKQRLYKLLDRPDFPYPAAV
jgi:NAD(P)H-nitrite reductase large subunit